MKESSVTTVKEDKHTGELYFELPSEVIDQVGWAAMDVLEWFDNEDGTWRITKKAVEL